jgi:hypothetical protein
MLVQVARIYADADCWPRFALDRERIEEFCSIYETDGIDALPPVELVADNQERWLLADGWHRVAALRILGIEQVHATIVAPAEGTDAKRATYLLAVARSAISSKPLSRAEKQQTVVALVEMYPDASDRELGRIAGVDHKTVGRLRERGISPAAQTSRPAPTPEQAAVRLFRAFEKIRDASGIGFADWLRGGDRSGQRLADVLYDVYGDDAAARAREFIAWLQAAWADLDESEVQ